MLAYLWQMDDTTDFAQTCVGTPYYLSPEVIEGRPYNHLSDVWALGVVQHGQCAPLAAPQLGSCASSGRAWRLWAMRPLRGRSRLTGRPDTASSARASRLQRRRFPPPLTLQARL